MQVLKRLHFQEINFGWSVFSLARVVRLFWNARIYNFGGNNRGNMDYRISVIFSSEAWTLLENGYF